MSKIPAFSLIASVQQGKLQVYDKAGLSRYLSQFGDGEELDLLVGPAEKKRTGKQNRFFHGPVLTAFMDFTGYTKEEAKEELCLRFLPREHRRMDGSVVTVPGHTSGLTVEDFNLFLDSCIQLAAELNILIEDGAEWRQRRTA